MALNRLLTLIAQEGIEPNRRTVAQWVEYRGDGDWEPEPSYGCFVDDRGQVILGTEPPRAFLKSDDPRTLDVDAATKEVLGEHFTLVFVDWGRQPLSWAEIFDLWDAWESQDMVIDCGQVGTLPGLSDRWSAPCWVAFRGDFDGSPLSTVVRQDLEAGEERTSDLGSRPLSFLARASKLRDLGGEAELPMLPFTLESLKDPQKVWPQGVA